MRQFYLGAVLALSAAILFLPAWLFLIHEPRISHAALAGAVVLPLIVSGAAAGVRSLLACVREHPLDLLTAFSVGVLLIFLVMLLYTGMFLFALGWPGR